MHHILSSVFDTKKHRKHILRIGFIIVSCCRLEGKNHFVSFLNLFIHAILKKNSLKIPYILSIYKEIYKDEKKVKWPMQ